MTTLITLPVLGYVLLTASNESMSPGKAPLFVIASLICALFVAGISGFLKPAAIGLFWSGMLAGIYGGWRLQQGGRLRQVALSPPLMVLVVLTFIHWFLFQNAEYFKWDEFSHWGLVVRDMLGHDTLYGPDSSVAFLNYPPAIPLWNYFVTLNLGYSEGATYTAQFVVLIAALLPLLDRLNWRDTPAVVAATLTMLFLLSVLGHGWASLYVDHVVAALFLGVILVQLNDEPSVRQTFLLLPPLVVLALVKDVGIYFAACGGLFVLVRFFCTRNISAGLAILLTIMTMATPLLASGLWSARQTMVGVTEEARKLDAATGIQTTLGLDIDPAREPVLSRFAEVLFAQQTGSDEMSIRYNEFSYPLTSEYSKSLQPSAVGWGLIALLMFAGAFWLAPDKRRQVTATALFMFGTTLLYLGLLLCLYLFIFPERAGLNLVSYVRYANIVLLPLIGIAFAVHLPNFSGGHRASHWIPPALATLLYVLSPPYLPALYKKPWKQPFRHQFAPIAEYVLSNTAPGDKILVDIAREAQFYRMMIAHDLSPAVSHFNLEPPGDLTPDALTELLTPYRFVIFTRLDQPLARLVISFIPEAEMPDVLGTLFRIELGADGLQLHPIDPNSKQVTDD